MTKRMLITVVLLLNAIVASAKAEDIVTVCSSCSPSQVEKSALQATSGYGTVHVVDFKTGQVQSFHVMHEFELGLEMHVALPEYTPYTITTAAREISYVLNDVVSNGGNYNEHTNTLTQTLIIPSHIAATSTDVREYVKSQAVSNFIRLELIADFWSKFDKAWQKVVEKIIFKVEAEFPDQTTAIYTLGPIFFSDHPFILERGSIKDVNGNPILTGSIGGGIPSVSYGGISSQGGSGGVSRECRGYTISYESFSWDGSVCWYTRS